MKTITILMTTLLSALVGALSAAEPDAPSWTRAAPATLEDVIESTLRANASLRSAQDRWRALEKRPDIVRALPDPMLSYGHWLRSVETRVGAMENRIALSQRFPAPGKRSLGARKAGLEALAAMWEYQTLARSLILKVRLAWYDRLRILETREVLQEELSVLRSLERTAIARYETGQAQQQDVLKAQLAATSITNRLHGLRQQEETARTQLNALLNRPPDTTLPMDAAWLETPLPRLQMLIDAATRYRQELKAAGVAIERDEVAAQLARRDRWPDITVGVDYTQLAGARFGAPPDSGKDAVMGWFGINIPLWRGKLKAQQEEADLRLKASKNSHDNLVSEVASEVQDAWRRAQVAADQIRLYDEGLLPQAEQTLSAALSSYQAVKGGFLDVLDAQRVLLNFRIGKIMSQWDRARGMAHLERAVGVDLEELKTLKSLNENAP